MTSNPILRPQNRRSQISSTPNSPFRPNNMPAMRPPCGISWQKRPNKTQPQGLNGRSTIRLPGHRRHAHHFTRQAATRADPHTKSQAARATFPRTQALSVSTARPHQHSQHFERQAFPTSPPGRKRHANATPAKPLAAYPTPCQPNLQLHVHQTPMPFLPGLSHFPEKAAALFHVEGKTRERRRVRNASPAGKGARHGRANI